MQANKQIDFYTKEKEKNIWYKIEIEKFNKYI